MSRKGLVLAGGAGSRLWPATSRVSKQLMPVYDKPMIYYPICTLMLGGIRDILIISTPQDLALFRDLLGDGSQWGVNFNYAIQPEPGGLAQAYTIGRDFVENSPSALILGDNVFYGQGLASLMRSATQRTEGATIFAAKVSDPARFGVVDFDASGKALSIEEKPISPKSNFAVTGLYFYDADAIHFVRTLQPSSRGELEITDLNNIYLENGSMSVEVLGRGYAWLDTGTHESLLEASFFISTLQKRQGLLIASPEEIAFQQEWIDQEALLELARPLSKTFYGAYLQNLAEQKI